MENIWKPLLAGGALLSSSGVIFFSAGSARADTITTAVSANGTTQTHDAPVLTGSQVLVAKYYAGSAYPTDSSDPYVGTAQTPANGTGDGGVPGTTLNYVSDATVGANSYVTSYYDWLKGDVHGNPTNPGQSFTTGNSAIALNTIGFTLADPDNASASATDPFTLSVFKLNADGTLTSVYSNTLTGTPFTKLAQPKSTEWKFSNGPTLAANSTYVFTVSEDALDAIAVGMAALGSSPGGNALQQEVAVNQGQPNANGTYNFLTYSGRIADTKNANGTEVLGQSRAQAVSFDSYTQYKNSSGTSAYTTDSSNISGTTLTGTFKGASNLGIDQIDFYVVGTPVVPEPASLGLLGVAGLGLLARRRKE